MNCTVPMFHNASHGFAYLEDQSSFLCADCASRLGHLYGRLVTAEGLGRAGVCSGRLGHIEATLATHGAYNAPHGF